MNPHILFVIDHLENPSKYTQEELDANYDSARAASDTAEPVYIVARAAYVVARAAYYAAYYAAEPAYYAAHWIYKYFKITGEDKKTYIDKLGE